MIHPEGQPLSNHIEGPITEAEIALQQIKLDNIDIERKRHERQLEVEALDPAAIDYAARILTQVIKEARTTDESSATNNKTGSL